MRATDDGQVKTYTCLPVMGLVPASFGDGRPAVFGSVAHGGCPSDACVLRAHPRLTAGTDCLHADTSCVDVARDYRPLPRRTNGVAPAACTPFRPCPQLKQHPEKKNKHAEEAI